MDIRPGDILLMKKPHPCGSARWQVERIGADLGLRCLGCGHGLLQPRHKILRNIKQVLRPESFDG